ncbi:MAG: aldolase/citrate lyase family protein [Pseudomonadota bacterium]
MVGIDSFALAMIETAESVENLEKIAATPGLDGIYVGPADLALGTQAARLVPGFDRKEPEMVDPIRRIAKVCDEKGIKACLHCATPDHAAKAISCGYHLTTVSGDTRLLAAAASAGRFRELTTGADAQDAGSEGGR